MPERTDPVRIRIMAREPGGSTDPREDFWSPLRNSEQFNQTSTHRLEAKLQREFGPALREALVEQLSEAYRAIDADAFPKAFRDLERMWFGPMPEREWMRYQVADAFTKMVEHRLEVLRETPAIRDAQARVASAAGVIFSTRIAGYSSLDLDLSVGSIEKLVDVFDGHFDSFRVFLEAFVPSAFAEVFTEDFADGFHYSIQMPGSMSTAFSRTAAAGTRGHRESNPAVQSAATHKSEARERAEWIWKLANGSLLVPVILALLVMYYGLRLISDTARDQRHALTPIIEHQPELLREDRQRLVGEDKSRTSLQTNVDSQPTAPVAIQPAENAGK